MLVKIISYTQPTEEIKKEGIKDIQELLAYCARVSNPTNQINVESSKKLIKYLIEHKHWSVFTMADVTMEIVTTRDIARQILRHASFQFQEFSQRYANIHDLEDNMVLRKARLQHPTNRQDSIITDDVDLHLAWEQHQRAAWQRSMQAYDWAISSGIAKEQARAVLPEGLTVSKLYMKGSIRSWIHYCALRSANGTQKEHVEVANECIKQLSTLIPDFEYFCSLQ